MNERNKQSASRRLLPPPFHDYLDPSIISTTGHSTLIKRLAIHPHATLTQSCVLRYPVHFRLEGFVPRPPSDSSSTTRCFGCFKLVTVLPFSALDAWLVHRAMRGVFEPFVIFERSAVSPPLDPKAL